MSSKFSAGIATVIMAAGFGSSAAGQVYPAHPHGGYNGIPFWVDQCTYQQVFDSAQFGSDPIEIHSLGFATGSFYNGEDFRYDVMIIRMGYTDKAPGGLSSVLSSNPRGAMTEVLNSPGFHGIVDYGGPDHFALIFPFTTPFCYDPGNGNLLIEIEQHNTLIGLDVSTSYGVPDASRAWNSNVFGNMTDTIAARMMFEVVPCASNLTLSLGGHCPGTINVAWNGATANKQMGIVYAGNTGSANVPGGPCAGTRLGLGSNHLQLVNMVGTRDGSGSVNGQAGPGACGGFVQLVVVDGSPCSTSNVVRLP